MLQLNEAEQGGLEGCISALLPKPDLTDIRASISALERKVEKAFPHAKWGSNRDKYAYKRVAPALRVRGTEVVHGAGCLALRGACAVCAAQHGDAAASGVCRDMWLATLAA